jgi:hypothetical protein
VYAHCDRERSLQQTMQFLTSRVQASVSPCSFVSAWSNFRGFPAETAQDTPDPRPVAILRGEIRVAFLSLRGASPFLLAAERPPFLRARFDHHFRRFRALEGQAMGALVYVFLSSRAKPSKSGKTVVSDTPHRSSSPHIVLALPFGMRRRTRRACRSRSATLRSPSGLDP